MKITIDSSLCSGHARCAAAAPEVFRLDDDGYALPYDGEVPPELEQAARDGELACPERAITAERCSRACSTQPAGCGGGVKWWPQNAPSVIS